MFNLTYDINITTAFVGLTSAVAFYILVVRLGDRTKASAARVLVLEAAITAKAAGDRVAHLEIEVEGLRTAQVAAAAQFGMYREQVARDLCSRETLREFDVRVTSHIREVEMRVTDRIEGLGVRIDRIARIPE